MDWTNQCMLRFLELYEAEPVIWSRNHKEHKDKSKVRDAWTRIANTLGKSVDELKAKKNSLMATFRSYRRRKQASIKSGATDDDVYKPMWFAFDVMERFLAPVYHYEKQYSEEIDENAFLHAEDRQTTGEYSETPHLDNNVQLKYEWSDETSYADNSDGTDMGFTDLAAPASRRPKRRHQTIETEDVQQQIEETFTTPNNMLPKKGEDDDCDLYAKLLAKRLRNYSEYERQKLMYEIDGLLLSRPPQKQEHSMSCSGSSYVVPSPVNSNKSVVDQF